MTVTIAFSNLANYTHMSVYHFVDSQYEAPHPCTHYTHMSVRFVSNDLQRRKRKVSKLTTSMSAIAPAHKSQGYLFVLLTPCHVPPGVELQRLSVDISIHVHVVDRISDKTTLGNHFARAFKLQVPAADILAECGAHRLQANRLLQAQIDEWKLSLPLVQRHPPQCLDGILWRAGWMLGKGLVDLSAHLGLPLWIQRQVAQHPSRVDARVEQCRQKRHDEELDGPMNIKTIVCIISGLETEAQRRETYRDNSEGRLALVHQLLHNVVLLPSRLPPIFYDPTHHEIKLYPSD